MAENILDPTELAEQARRGRLKLIIAAAVVVVLLAAAAAYFLLSAREAESERQAAAEETVSLGPVQYLELTPSFVVNFPLQGRQRFLQTNLAIMSRDSAGLLAVSEHMPAVRHALINLFSAQLIRVFEDPSGIEELRMLATNEVKELMKREIGREAIDEVLFTTFVLQ